MRLIVFFKLLDVSLVAFKPQNSEFYFLRVFLFLFLVTFTYSKLFRVFRGYEKIAI